MSQSARLCTPLNERAGIPFFTMTHSRTWRKKISVTARMNAIADVLGRVLSNTLLTHKFLEGKLIVIVLKDAPEKIGSTVK